ncbi:glutamate--tRNA ligase [Candidatus Synchoanobacter obligatus]|uniref:Glutamate--tRNA ligase n=1 Tax=Candidatus Synchoanobacter obligatus TaxID=2919597 RepID=A0ABT1L5W5_9GAMM|nr:glutamate--tRNA ligase [Candidatus Synchoanobacter obligatus]MCP8352555.1 glutamate--tRNA ligase [Candidatus Synchoanobacter obligatus]
MSMRVRFAPSPTGSLHLGGVRTALYNFLLAKKNGGAFVIRVEDTDLERNQQGAENNQLADLAWLGIEADEGPNNPGDYGPYYQSKRQDIYQQHAETLVKEGKAFYCFLTDAELDALHSHENRQLKSPYRDTSLEEAQAKIDAGESCVIRFKNNWDDRVFQFDDLVHGTTELAGDMVGDFVLIRSNKQPVYNFCCAVDDHLMAISHVLRGEEHLSNTLRQLMIYDAFGWDIPQFGHLSMILGANRKKLSKRDDAVSVKDFVSSGYLPQAILNYVALLGWSHSDGEEKFTLDEMISSFTLDRVNKSPAMFDRDKLNWLNHYHLNQYRSEEVAQALQDISSSPLLNDTVWFEQFWTLIGHQFHTLLEVNDTLAFFEQHEIRDKELLLGEGRDVVTTFQGILSNESNYSEEAFLSAMKATGEQMGVKGKRLFAPIRVALIGIQSGMELKVIGALMTKDQVLERINAALLVG